MKTLLVVLAVILSSFSVDLNSEKREVFEKINNARISPDTYKVLKKDGYSPMGALMRDVKLDSVAQAHADVLAAQGGLFHSANIYTECCCVTYGDVCPVASWIVDSDTPSLGHRKAIMCKSYKKIGIGIAKSKDKTYYVIELQ